MKPSIFLAGAFDRFNFGDLLFPLITRQAFERLGIEANFEVLASRWSDLKEAGALPTAPLGKLSQHPPGPGDTLLLAGGEILDARWSGTLAALTSPRRAFGLKVLAKGFPAMADALSQRALTGAILGTRRPLPWVLGKEDFASPMGIAYNGVGGSGIDGLPPKLQEALRRRLDRAAFLSVRDPRTLEILNRWNLHCPIHLAPDPAALMAEIFPRPHLEDQQSQETRDLRAGYEENGYGVVQLGYYAARGAGPAVAEQLIRLQRVSGLNLVLVPLGQAAGHEDQRALAALQKRLVGLPVTLASATTIIDILSLIAGSRLFAGTSLHGNLTALAYGVPRVGLGPGIRKLDLFLRTWDSQQPSGCASFDDFADRALEALEKPLDLWQRDGERIVREGWKNFENLAATLQWPSRQPP
ncbi:MAG: polysaccharide pyruvyl transferase family protein [Deltaproteobacteria bacterium]|nr:polysaccharide pyruvyl transferase family protein [Deltaproteobacteria bacterium]